jgi:hypothetical protein
MREKPVRKGGLYIPNGRQETIRFDYVTTSEDVSKPPTISG